MKIRTPDRHDLFNNLESMGMTKWDVNNMFALNQWFANSSEVLFLRERTERILRQALLVMTFNRSYNYQPQL